MRAAFASTNHLARPHPRDGLRKAQLGRGLTSAVLPYRSEASALPYGQWPGLVPASTNVRMILNLRNERDRFLSERREPRHAPALATCSCPNVASSAVRAARPPTDRLFLDRCSTSTPI